MKKIFILVLSIFCLGTTMAQENNMTREQMRQYLLQTQHKRDIAKRHLNSNIQLAPA